MGRPENTKTHRKIFHLHIMPSLLRAGVCRGSAQPFPAMPSPSFRGPLLKCESTSGQLEFMLEQFSIVYNSYIAVLVSSCPAGVCKKTPCLQRLGCQGSCVLCSLIRVLPLVVSVQQRAFRRQIQTRSIPHGASLRSSPLYSAPCGVSRRKPW